jgi:hypothetical protein
MANRRFVLSLASKIAARLLADYNDYLDMCADYAREGYRAPHCEHGMNLWTDYDPICGPCEDGMTMRDGVERRTYALDQAKRRMEEFDSIMALYNGPHADLLDKDKTTKRITELLTP